jgi:acetamidase/formamidase
MPIWNTWPLRGDGLGVTISRSVLHRSPLMPRRYEIPSIPQNMVWGYLDSSTPHILEVSSGDTVTLHSFPSGGKETLPDDINLVPSDYLAALETLPPGPGSHFITGPIYVRGAAVGDALQIDILDVKVRQDWGFVSILPLLGTLPDEFTDYETIHPRIDRQRNVCIMPWGSEIPLEPFFGIIATAPPPGWGRCGSPVPRAFGGNMDNKELRTTLYLPVFNEGAMFFAGDGHAVQGDGEPTLRVCDVSHRICPTR